MHCCYTAICEIFIVKNFCCAQSDKFLHENSLPVLTYTVNIWHELDFDENIVTQKFLA